MRLLLASGLVSLAIMTGAWTLQSDLIGFEHIAALPNPAPTARIAYGNDPLQFGDLRLPPGAGPHPVVVVIHGGCWRSQYEIDHIGAFSDALTRSGVATWAIEYRRVGNPGGGWPGTFLDVGAAVDHLRRVAQAHPIDLARVVAVGHSAGGHLALWLGARGKLTDPTLRADDPLPLKGIVSLAGVDNLRRALGEGVCGDQITKLVGGTPDEVPERYAQGSPIELLPIGVPQHLVNGARDPIVPEAFGRDYAAAGRRAGDDVKLTILPNAGHFELIAPTTPEWSAVREAILERVEP
jgi:acetyl esterase/lipase